MWGEQMKGLPVLLHAAVAVMTLIVLVADGRRRTYKVRAARPTRSRAKIMRFNADSGRFETMEVR